MPNGGIWKLAQKQAYDIVSHRYGMLLVLGVIAFVTISALHFGETLLEWSHEKYAVVFNSYSDNIAGKSFRESNINEHFDRLCLPVPIDVVYTWVNGSDPSLLRKLHKVKVDAEKELNISREEKCHYAHCAATSMVVFSPALPRDVSLKDLAQEYPPFEDAIRLFHVEVQREEEQPTNHTVVSFPLEFDVKSILNITLKETLSNYSMKQVFVTSDSKAPNSVKMSNMIILAGVPSTYTLDELTAKVPERLRLGVDKTELLSSDGIAFLHVSKTEDFNRILEVKNFTLEEKEPYLGPAYILWDLRDFSKDDDMSLSRYEDNEELRYSLRSIEKHAPWVRHIYIVTNGQIPYWLNMENPRMTVVTHEEIYQNVSHLPTFSSPSIETHIHRIPGLSKRFIYMNDDVMFGKDVWPDDFYSHVLGQRVYLAWPVPNCQEGCPSSWIKDGYCDKACNNSECEWDGGDCSGANANAESGGHWGGGHWGADNQQDNCVKGCPNNWLADKYCDATCNTEECGYDIGDCGTEHYSKLYGVDLHDSKALYSIPNGENGIYFNLTTWLGPDGIVEKASHNESATIRTAAISNKFKVLTILLYSHQNASSLFFKLQGHRGGENQTKEISFILNVDPKKKTQQNDVQMLAKNDTLLNDTKENITDVQHFELKDIAPHLWHPRALSPALDMKDALPAEFNDTIAFFPPELQLEYNKSVAQYEDGEITEKGFKLRLLIIWNKYKAYHLPGYRNQTFSHSDYFQKRKLLAVDKLDVNKQEKSNTVDKETWKNMVIHNASPLWELPWEKLGYFYSVEKEKKKRSILDDYKTKNFEERKLLDTFGESLRHVNKLFNQAFGYTARKVPAHMPHLIDKDVMEELQTMFPHEWEVTSSHKIRSPDDMQYAFSYFYFLMGIQENITIEEVFDEMDTDKSNVLSDREIRTLATRLYELPLDLQTLNGLESAFKNCSKKESSSSLEIVSEENREKYYEADMPQVTRRLFVECKPLEKIIRKQFNTKNKYKFTTEEENEIAFKMIRSNISTVVGQLDDIRKNPKKFICLNDNIDHSREEAKTIKAILQDFYESVFPLKSQFELPLDYRNRFLHIDELREWRKYRDWLKFWTHLALALLVLFTIASFFAEKIESAQKKLCRRGRGWKRLLQGVRGVSSRKNIPKGMAETV